MTRVAAETSGDKIACHPESKATLFCLVFSLLAAPDFMGAAPAHACVATVTARERRGREGGVTRVLSILLARETFNVNRLLGLMLVILRSGYVYEAKFGLNHNWDLLFNRPIETIINFHFF